MSNLSKILDEGGNSDNNIWHCRIRTVSSINVSLEKRSSLYAILLCLLHSCF